MSEDSNQNQQNNNSGAGSSGNNEQDKGKQGAGGEQKQQTVPLADFLEQKRLAKELKEKVSGYEDRDKKAVEAKLLEEKKYQDLISNKDKELGEVKSKLDQEAKGRKLDKLESKFTRSLEKNNAISAEDALKFIKFDDLVDSDDAEAEIKKRVDDLVKNKSYLFGSKQTTTRSSTENGQPSGNTGGQGQQGNQGKDKIDPIVLSLAGKLKQ